MFKAYQRSSNCNHRVGRIQETGLAMVMIASLIGVFGFLVFKRVQQNRLMADQTRAILNDAQEEQAPPSRHPSANPELVALIPNSGNPASEKRMPSLKKPPQKEVAPAAFADPFLTPTEEAPKPRPIHANATENSADSPWDIIQVSSPPHQAEPAPKPNELMTLFGDEPSDSKEKGHQQAAPKPQQNEPPKHHPAADDPFFAPNTQESAPKPSPPALDLFQENAPQPMNSQKESEQAPQPIGGFQFGHERHSGAGHSDQSSHSRTAAHAPTQEVAPAPWGSNASPSRHQERPGSSPSGFDSQGWQMVPPSQSTQREEAPAPFDRFDEPRRDAHSHNPSRQPAPAPDHFGHSNTEQAPHPQMANEPSMPRFLPPDQRINPKSIPTDHYPQTASRSEIHPSRHNDFLNSSSSGKGDYVVQSGDTFWAISRKQYGTAKYFAALEEYNKSNLKDGRVLKIGSHIVIPPTQTLEALYPKLTGQSTTGSSVSTVSHEPSGFYYGEHSAPMYRVGENDTLTGIAQSHLGRSSRWTQIFELNRDQLATPDRLKLGMVLRLPSDAVSVQMTSGQVEYR